MTWCGDKICLPSRESKPYFSAIQPMTWTLYLLSYCYSSCSAEKKYSMTISTLYLIDFVEHPVLCGPAQKNSFLTSRIRIYSHKRFRSRRIVRLKSAAFVSQINIQSNSYIKLYFSIALLPYFVCLLLIACFWLTYWTERVCYSHAIIFFFFFFFVFLTSWAVFTACQSWPSKQNLIGHIEGGM
jgi:hypothetical protein